MNGSLPTSLEELNARHNANYRVEGAGVEGVKVYHPCPFCSAKDFMVYFLLDAEQAMQKGGDCKECFRSAKFIITSEMFGKSMELVQTAGPMPPAWYPFPVRDLRYASAGHA